MVQGEVRGLAPDFLFQKVDRLRKGFWDIETIQIFMSDHGKPFTEKDAAATLRRFSQQTRVEYRDFS